MLFVETQSVDPSGELNQNLQDFNSMDWDELTPHNISTIDDNALTPAQLNHRNSIGKSLILIPKLFKLDWKFPKRVQSVFWMLANSMQVNWLWMLVRILMLSVWGYGKVELFAACHWSISHFQCNPTSEEYFLSISRFQWGRYWSKFKLVNYSSSAFFLLGILAKWKFLVQLMQTMWRIWGSGLGVVFWLSLVHLSPNANNFPNEESRTPF